MSSLLAILAVFLAAMAVVSGDICSTSASAPSNYGTPPYPLQPRLDQFPKTIANADVTLFGFLEIQDGCTLKISQFTYYPVLPQTYLYGTKGSKPDDPNANGFKVSKTLVNGANNFSQIFKLDANKALTDFDVVKLFDEKYNIVVGVFDLTGKTVGGGNNASTNAKASNNSNNPQSISTATYIVLLLGILTIVSAFL